MGQETDMGKKKILMRTGLSPFENLSEKAISDENLFGNNVGNLLYAFSLFRWLMTDEDTIVVPDRYRPERGECSEEEIDRINQEYSCYIMPMADTFRISFEKRLREYTRFIEKLKIPVVLVGVGISCALEEGAVPSCVPEEVVHGFMKAVLERSALVGLRGEFTVSLLAKMGYQEGKHITAIGCPSMYTYGDTIGKQEALHEPVLSSEKTLLLSNSIFASDQIHRFIRRMAGEYPNHLYIPQRIEEMRMFYNGKDMDLKILPKDRKEYPVSLSDPIFSSGRACFPMNIQGWLKAARGAGMAVGPRLHGSVAAMLSGVPALMIQKDWRTKEVGQYHHFAMVDPSVLTDETRLPELMAGQDFHGPEKVQKENAAHYLGFLKANEVPTIYENGFHRKKMPFDRKLEKTKADDPILPYTQISAPARALRNANRLWNAVTYRSK